jgi:hypothetical protein
LILDLAGLLVRSFILRIQVPLEVRAARLELWDQQELRELREAQEALVQAAQVVMVVLVQLFLPVVALVVVVVPAELAEPVGLEVLVDLEAQAELAARVVLDCLRKTSRA